MEGCAPAEGRCWRAARNVSLSLLGLEMWPRMLAQGKGMESHRVGSARKKKKLTQAQPQVHMHPAASWARDWLPVVPSSARASAGRLNLKWKKRTNEAAEKQRDLDRNG